jgi:hypothetical protein
MTTISKPARPLAASQFTGAVVLAAALLAPPSATALVCTHLRPSGPGTSFFPDSQLAVVQAGPIGSSEPPAARAVSTDCTGVDINGAFTSGALYSAAAQATPAVVRARARSEGTEGVDAVARGALVFRVSADKPLLPKDGPLLAFHVDADGIYGGTGSTPGSATFALSVNANASAEKLVEHFIDSNGFDRPQAFFSSNRPSALAKVTIDFEGFFPVGDAFFTILLNAFAQPHSFSDFASTATLTSITVLSPGYSLELPDGLFVADPTQPGRYLLADLGAGSPPGSVPEPGTLLLLLGGLAVLAWRRDGSASPGSWQAHWPWSEPSSSRPSLSTQSGTVR